MSRRNRIKRDRRIRFTLWGMVVLLGVLVFLCRHPYVWHQESAISPGVPITLTSVSDYLIVADETVFDSAPATYPEMSFSYAWLNTFQQEIGPVSLVSARQFTESNLNQVRVLILTQSVANRSDWVPKIRGMLERGTTVIMEMPEGKLRDIASADGKGGLRTPQSVTYMNGILPEYMTAMQTLHLSDMTQIIGSAGPLDDAQTWMTIDGVPVIYSKPYATGTVITVDMNYGMLLTTLQQGRPQDDFSIRNVRGQSSIETQDLARTETLDLPIADILERFLIYGVLNTSYPSVGFWPFFDGMNGAMIVNHRENHAGDAALWMAQYEATFKATSTVFVTSPLTITDDGIMRLEKQHAEIGSEVSLYPHASSLEPVGPFKFSPVWRLHNIYDQAQNLRSLLGDHSTVVTSCIRDGLWTDTYSRAFRILAAAEFRADASYRAPSSTPGFAFGTGFPFMPLDTNGLGFNLQEFPVIFPQLETQETLKQLESTLRSSAEQMHEAITISFDPNSYAHAPEFEKFDVWQTSYRLATDHQHWITSILNFLRFSRARYTAELKSRVVSMRLGNKPVTNLRLEILAPEAGMSVTVPKTTNDRTFGEARRGLQRVREDALLTDSIATTSIHIMGYERILIPLTRGFNAIDVIYE